MGVFSSHSRVKSLLNSFICFVAIVALFLATSAPTAHAEPDSSGPTYTGPTQLSSAQANPSGGCACGTTMSGGAGMGAIAFAAALGVYALGSAAVGSSKASADNKIEDITDSGQAAVAKINTRVSYQDEGPNQTDVLVDISDMAPSAVLNFIRALDDKTSEFQIILPQDFIDSGATLDVAALRSEGFDVEIVTTLQLPPYYGYNNLYINQTFYEDVVAVVEMEKIGNDYYLTITEVRESDVSSFIANQNQPDNIYQVIMAAEFFADQGGTDNTDYIPNGYTGSAVQAIELPPADTYSNLFYLETDGTITDWTPYTVGTEMLAGSTN